MHHFFQGLLIGIAIAAPVGPIGLLCIRRSIMDGRLAGLSTGLGAATADAIYGFLAAFGVAAITGLLLRHGNVVQLAGGIFLIILGLRITRSRTAPAEGKATHAPSLAAAYFSGLGLTLANPVTIVAFLGIFSALGLGGPDTTPGAAAGVTVLGVFLGSCAWWLLLSAAASWIAGRINHGTLRIINWGAGGLLVAIGLYELAQLALHL